jgi:glycosyltransferase involved in cell wall biosynthesis
MAPPTDQSDPAAAPPVSDPEVSVVIPIYNEEEILEDAVTELLAGLDALGVSHEVVLAENGSRDRTVEVAADLGRRFPGVRSFSVDEPNYGKALREGILRARGRFVLCDEIDLCDTDFHARALELLEGDRADLVVGSKVMPGAADERPFVRRLGTLAINGLLRLTLGFQGTDTHGLKAFRRDAVTPIAERCLVDKDLFASELVIRAERAEVRVVEIPVRIKEKRAPSIGLFRRVPRVLSDLTRLVVAIRFRG